jgi:hypothetical protein
MQKRRPIDHPHQRAILPPGRPRELIDIRGPSGRLYGRLDPQTMIMEFQRGKEIERIDLSLYQQMPGPAHTGDGDRGE